MGEWAAGEWAGDRLLARRATRGEGTLTLIDEPPGALPTAEPAVRLGSADFPVFYQKHYPAIASYAWTLVRDREQAEDITQEAFTRLLARWRKVREPRPYLYQVTTNLARNAWQRSARHQDTITALASQPVELVGAADSGLSVREAVERLPVRLRDAVLLFYYADLTVNDVAAALGRPVGTVKRLLNEARSALSVSLADPSGKDPR